MGHAADNHIVATQYARKRTIEKFGATSVPCEPGTEAHKFWLTQFDNCISEIQADNDQMIASQKFHF